jgi:hypothetical protein
MQAAKSADFTTLSLNDEDDEEVEYESLMDTNNEADNNLQKPLLSKNDESNHNNNRRVIVVGGGEQDDVVQKAEVSPLKTKKKWSPAATVCAWTLFVIVCVTVILVVVAMIESNGFSKAVHVTPESFVFTGFKFNAEKPDAAPEVLVDYKVRVENSIPFDMSIAATKFDIQYSLPSSNDFQSFGVAKIAPYKVTPRSESVVKIPTTVEPIDPAEGRTQ